MKEEKIKRDAGKRYRLKFVSSDGRVRRKVVLSVGGDELKGEIEATAMLYEMQYGGTWRCDEAEVVEE